MPILQNNIHLIKCYCESKHANDHTSNLLLPSCLRWEEEEGYVCVWGRERTNESSITSFLIMDMCRQHLKPSTLISTSLSHQNSIVGGAGYTGNLLHFYRKYPRVWTF